jgi:hypothetical protein
MIAAVTPPRTTTSVMETRAMIRRSEAAGHLVPRAAGKLRWPSVAGQRRSLAGQEPLLITERSLL